MKNIICPHCGKEVKKVIGLYWKASSLYSLDRDTVSQAWFWYPFFPKAKKKNPRILGFYCRFCSESYPKRMEKEIWKFLKARRVLNKLKGL